VVYLQAEVFKYQVMGKWEAGKGEHQVAWLEREDWGGTGYCLGRPSGLGSFACSFSLTLLSGVAIFTLFQSSSAFDILTFQALCYIGVGVPFVFWLPPAGWGLCVCGWRVVKSGDA
jgi:hypothetical protein